eukprot:3304713-Prymnesium_polylepis.3
MSSKQHVSPRHIAYSAPERFDSPSRSASISGGSVTPKATGPGQRESRCVRPGVFASRHTSSFFDLASDSALNLSRSRSRFPRVSWTWGSSSLLSDASATILNALSVYATASLMRPICSSTPARLLALSALCSSVPSSG